MMKKIKKESLMMRWVSIASLVVAFTLIVLKGIAFLWTGSVAILSGLFDSETKGNDDLAGYSLTKKDFCFP